MSAFPSIRKYLTILSLFFFFVTLGHLALAYLYLGSKTVPERGGAVSVGFVNAVPSLSPVQAGADPVADFALRLLYRSLLRYDVESRTMRGDLANCDLGKDFSEIRCFPKDGAAWNDGTPVTKADVLATYALFSETDLNKRLQAALSKTSVEDSGDAIVFRTDDPNVDLLEVFTLPIVSAEAAESIRKGEFRPESGPFSGPYAFEKRETDAASQSERIVLSQNPNFSTPPYVSRYALRFFSDRDALLSARDSLNVVYPSRAVGPISSPRFAPLKLSLPEFVGVFANVSELPADLRSLVLSLIGNAKLASAETASSKPVKNPFFTDESAIPEPETKNPEEILAKHGFFKKAALIERLKRPVPAKAAKTNRYFVSPTNEATYVGGDAEEILISGSVPDSVTEVYVNEYRLQSFVPKSGKFYYRAKTSLRTLREGRNEYALSFVENGVKVRKESLVVEYVKDPAEREKRRSELRSEAARIAAASSSGALETAMAKYDGLDPNAYYDESGNPFVLRLRYAAVSPEIPLLASEIAEVLKGAGFSVDAAEISTEDLQKKVILGGQKEYDLLLAGVNLGLLGYNVFPFFHSGQAEVGYNFSKIKNPSLDVLLEELKSKDFGDEGLKNVRSKILAILRKEAAVVAVSSPYLPYSIDRSVKNAHVPEIVPSSPYLFDVLEGAYVNESRIADFRDKSVGGFVGWVRGLLASSK